MVENKDLEFKTKHPDFKNDKADEYDVVLLRR